MRILRKYATSTTVAFSLRDFFAGELYDTALASGDTQVSIDGGAFANPSTAVPTKTQTGQYELELTAGETTGKRITIHVVDQTSPKAFCDVSLEIETYGHTSAQIDVLDANVVQINGSADNVTSLMVASAIRGHNSSYVVTSATAATLTVKDLAGTSDLYTVTLTTSGNTKTRTIAAAE